MTALALFALKLLLTGTSCITVAEADTIVSTGLPLVLSGQQPGGRFQIYDRGVPIALIVANGEGTARFDGTSLIAGRHVLRVVEVGTGKALIADKHVAVEGRIGARYESAAFAGGLQPENLVAWPDGGASAGELLIATREGAFSLNGLHPALETARYAGPVSGGGQIVFGDFNADGAGELASIRSDGCIQLAFQGKTDLPAPRAALCDYFFSGLAVADFDGDGIVDLAAISERDSRLVAFHGLGDGSFSKKNETITLSPRAMLVCDFSVDGLPDLAVSSFAANGVTVFLGRGDGTFSPQQMLQVADADKVDSGDLDGDGWPDLVTSSRSSGDIHVFRGNGKGGFSRDVVIGIAQTFLVADCDGDGHDDIVLLTSQAVERWSLVGEWSFAPADSLCRVSGARWLVSGDWNRDSIPDFAIGDIAGTIQVIVSTWSARTEVSPAALADLAPAGGALPGNNAGASGLVTTTVSLTSSEGSVHLGRTLLLYASVTPAAASGKVAFYDRFALLGTGLLQGGSTSIRLVARLNRGQHALRAVYLGNSVHSQSVSPTLNQLVTAMPRRGLSAPVELRLDGRVDDLLATELNGDRRPDIAAISGLGELTIFLSRRDGTLREVNRYHFASMGTYKIAAGDLNGDGFTDLVILNYSESQIAVMPGNGDGSFQAARLIALNRQVASLPTALVLEDFNSDGSLDLAVACESDAILVIPGNGDATFRSPVLYPVAPDPDGLRVGDFNRDGIADLVASGFKESVSVLFGRADGTFSPAQTVAAGFSVGSLSVFDMDGDGLDDVVLVSSGKSGRFGILKGAALGSGMVVSGYTSSLLADGVPEVEAGDFREDGKGELLVTQGTGSLIRLSLNGSGTDGVEATLTALNGSPRSIRVTDLNGDGRSDVIVGNGDGSLLLMFGLSPGRPQTIAFPRLPSTAVEKAYVTASAAASSALPLTVFATPASVCDADGDRIALRSAGFCSVAVVQQGDESWAAAASSQTFKVGRTQLITLLASDTNSGVTLQAVATSALPVSLTSQTPQICTVVESTAVTLQPGNCTVSATQEGDLSWAPADPVNATYAVQGLRQTIAFAELPDAHPGDAPLELVATASSGLPISFSTFGMDVCKIAGGLLSFTGTGECVVVARQNGSAPYLAATPVSQSLRVRKLQTISFSIPSEMAAGSTAVISAVTALGAASLTAGPATVCILAGSLLTALKEGVCSVTAAREGNTEFAPAGPITQAIVIRRSQTITFSQVADRPADSPPVDLNVLATSALPVTISSGTPAICSIAGSRVTILSAGLCSLTASQSGSAVYMAAPSVTVSFNAIKVPATISFSPASLTQIYSGTARTVIVSTAPADLAVRITYNGGVDAPINAGVYSVTAAVADPRYEGSAGTTLVIGKASPVVEWTQPADIFSGVLLTSTQLRATASVPGAFVYTPAAGSVLPVGTHVLSALFTANDPNYVTATVTATLTVKPVQGVQLVLSTATAREPDGRIAVTITIRNNGSASAPDCGFTSAKLGGLLPTDPLPALGTIEAGASRTAVIRFPPSAGAAGTSSVFSVSGIYQNGTFSSSGRITLP